MSNISDYLEFSLDDFIKDEPSLETPKPPEWFNNSNETVKTLYQSALDRYLAIRDQIQAGQVKGGKDIKIMASHVAKNNGLSKSYMTNRASELNDLIKVWNRSLAELYNWNRSDSNARARRTDGRIDNLKREDILKALKKLLREVELLRSDFFAQQAYNIFRSGISETQAQQAKIIEQLRSDNDNLRDNLRNSNKRADEASHQLTKTLTELAELKVKLPLIDNRGEKNG